MDVILHFRGQSRFADPGFAGNHDCVAIASLGVLPAQLEMLELIGTANE